MATYYFSATGNDTNNGTSTLTPFQTFTKLQTICNNGTVVPGDFLSFKQGDTFTGKAVIGSIYGNHAKSGTVGNPITINSYGSGVKPIFLYPSGGSATPEQRTLLLFQGLNYWTIDGINFTDSNTTNDKVTGANCGFPIYIGGSSTEISNNFVVNHVDISLCGMGVVFYGSNNTIMNSTMTNFKNLKSTTNTGGSSAYDDYGANPVTMQGNGNIVFNCFVSGGWAESLDFGYNGGFCEMFGSNNNNSFLYNTIVDCGGISEYGASGSATSSDNNMYVYNKIINCGNLLYANISGVFHTEVSNTLFYNNTVIEQNGISRFSGSNFGAGIVSSEANSHKSEDHYIFLYNTAPVAPIIYNVKNSVFQLNTGIKIATTNNTEIPHTYNAYKLSNGSTVNMPLGTGEFSTLAAIFTDTTGTNASTWDCTPVVGSPLINAGTTIAGQTRDIVGNPIVGLPDIGAYEYVSPVSGPLVATVIQNALIGCNGNTTTVTVSASGGTAPYTGTGTFTVSAGFHSYPVTDSASGSAIASLTVTQPTALSVTASYSNLIATGTTTTVTAIPTGGTAPYQYKIDSGAFKSSTSFAGIAEGTHVLVIQDANGCLNNFSFTVSVIGGGILRLDYTKVNTTCKNTATGSITLIASGGTPPYTYRKNGSSYTSTTVYTNLARALYNMKVKDSIGAVVTQHINITPIANHNC